MDLLKPLTLVAAMMVASPANASELAVTQAWSRPAVAGGVGVGFMVLSNKGKAPEVVVKVESPAAREVQIHQTSMAAGMSSMKMLTRLPLPPGGAVTFAPGGYHLMFIGLKAPLKVGDTLPATLTFASGARVQAIFKVQVSPPAATPGHAHGS
jgi:periplasmic copper chaperone A